MEKPKEDACKGQAVLPESLKMRDYFLFAVNSIRHRQMRSWLTVLGIVIGIAAIIALITVSQGLENAITSQFEMMGTSRIFIAPGGADFANYKMKGLTTKDADAVEGVSGIKWANPIIMGNAEVGFGNEKGFSEHMGGMRPDRMAQVYGDMDVKMEAGSLLARGDKYDAVIGNDVAHEFFERDVMVGNILKVKGERFKVKGVLAKIGSPDDDAMIMMPEEVYREIFNAPDEISVIDAQLYGGLDVDAVAGRVQRALERSRGNDDFNIMTPEQILKQFGDILMIVQVVLGGIAAISLLVGGIGIMNSMYTNVLERTREIGIMKSIGATNRDIMKIFLFEAGIMGIIGGVLGVMAGTGIAFFVGAIARQQGYQILEIMIDWKLVVFGIMFAFFVGAFSGYLPARQASKLSPVDSLRYGV